MATYKRVNGDYTIETLNGSDTVTLDTAATVITGDLTVVGNAVLTGNINADRIFYGTSNVEIPSPNGNVVVSVGGVNQIAVFTNSGANINGYTSVSGNVTGANINTAGLASVVGNVIGGNVVSLGNVFITRDASAGQPTLRFNDTDTDIADNQTFGAIEWFTNDVSSTGARVTASIRSVAAGLLGNANVQILTSTNGAAPTVKMTVLSTGNVGIGNAAPTDLLAVQGSVWSNATISAVGNITGGNLLTAGSATVTGNIQAGNLRTAGLASVTGNITGGNVISLGAVSAGAAGITATGNVRGGNVLSDGVISATGNLTTTDMFGSSVSVSGNVTANNISIGNSITSGNISVSTLMSGTGVGVENFVYQSSNTVISSATPANVGSLTFQALANNAYRFEALIYMVPDGAMTIAPAVLFSTGTCTYTTETQITSTSAWSVATKTASDDVATTYGTTGTDARTLRISGWFFHTGNTDVTMRLQNSTGNITITTGSYLTYTRIA